MPGLFCLVLLVLFIESPLVSLPSVSPLLHLCLCLCVFLCLLSPSCGLFHVYPCFPSPSLLLSLVFPRSLSSASPPLHHHVSCFIVKVQCFHVHSVRSCLPCLVMVIRASCVSHVPLLSLLYLASVSSCACCRDLPHS